MSGKLSVLDQLRLRRMRGFWQRKLKAGGIDTTLRQEAGRLRRILETVEQAGLAVDAPPSDPSKGLPGGTLWAIRPEPWDKPLRLEHGRAATNGDQIAGGVTLYFEAKEAKVFLRQSLSPQDSESAFALSLDIAEFDGEYVSLALGLPKDEIPNVQRTDLIRLDLSYGSTVPINAVARANIKIGPNIERITREIDRTRANPAVEFDLHYAELEAQEISDVWVDLIFERPSSNVITVNDLRLSRRPRAKA